MLNDVKKLEMKNKIFELYKPRSLQEFLEFHKNNPDEKFVYVVQQPAPNINILSASDNVLKWDKREYRYYPLEVDMYQKG
jgi:hypothetical protein